MAGRDNRPRSTSMPTVAVIGAGPAGLAAAFKLVSAGVSVDVFEAGHAVGGLARSFSFAGHTVDLGPHRFFTQDARVNRLWLEIVQDAYRMIDRRTRIYSGGRFFDYPLRPGNALRNLGAVEAIRCIGSYVAARNTRAEASPESFESWMVKRFGRRLYDRFFASYSAKLWGIPGDQLDADFAAQRIQGFSLGEALRGAFGLGRARHKTTLDRFAYPTEGTGSVYEKLARRIEERGGRIHLGTQVSRVLHEDRRVTGLVVDGDQRRPFEHVISTMPLTLLVEGLGDLPPAIASASSALVYRHTLMVYLEVDAIDLFPDQWIYVHEPGLGVGRVTNFRNWAPELCGPSPTTALALEYWCAPDDPIWTEPAEASIERATRELRATGLIGGARIMSGRVVRIPRCYPVYKLAYKRHVATIASYLSRYIGLTTIGRYGSFKYNNQDHSILMGILAAENVIRGSGHELWDVNSDSTIPHEIGVITATGLEPVSS